MKNEDYEILEHLQEARDSLDRALDLTRVAAVSAELLVDAREHSERAGIIYSAVKLIEGRIEALERKERNV